MEGIIFSLTEGAVRSLLCKLGCLLSHESWLLQGVRGEMQYIKDELESMNAFLRTLTMAEGHDDQVRIWMKQVREIAYDAEDCIDEFVHHLGEPSGMGFLRRLICMLRTLVCRRRIANQLQELKGRARDVGKRRSRYGVEVPKTVLRGESPKLTKHASLYLDPQLHALFTEETQMVRIDEPRDALVSWLMEDDPCLRVLAIVGFGGLGKTTLARMVCESPTVKGSNFHHCPLFIVSQIFNIRTLFQHMIRVLIQRPHHKASAIVGDKHGHFIDENLERIERWEVAALAEKLRRYLQDKRYLMILDDIWTISAWESIRCALPDNNMGSRVIVTTRNEDVAKICCSRPQDWIYKIQRLSDATSRELFFKRIFGSVDNLPNDDLEEVSSCILKKCGGLPLAIMSIGSLLASKTNRTKQEWQKVCDNLGSELVNNPTLEGAKQVLTLSYDDLPYHLKACFLYLSIFPENYVMKRGPLLRRWIAEGFVSQRHGLSLEQIAESYFEEFVARSIVQPVRIDWNGKVRSCRVHDIMLEVIVSKSVEENFASFLCAGSTFITHDKIRRLSMHSTHKLVQKINTSVSHVRSFTMSASVQEVPRFFPELQLLRVLDMQGCSCLSMNTLECVCDLFQLKYLSLRKTNVSKLPRRLGNLKHLETLDIRATLIKKLPASSKNLSCMKHMLAGHKVHLTRTASVKYLIPRSGLEMAPGVIKNMEDLQSLVHIVVKDQSSILQEIGLLQKLRKLNVLFRNVEANWKAFVESLGKLASSLHSLSIHILDEKEHSSYLNILDYLESPPLLITNFGLIGKLERLPYWISSLRSLSRFTLCNTGLHAEVIGVLGNLPNLLCLELYHKSYADGCIIFPRGKFAKLRMLVIDDLENIDKAHFEEGSVTNLERLTLSFLREPKDGISGLNNLPKLKEVEFFGNITLSVVNEVVSCLKTHPNHPRVVLEKWNS